METTETAVQTVQPAAGRRTVCRRCGAPARPHHPKHRDALCEQCAQTRAQSRQVLLDETIGRAGPNRRRQEQAASLGVSARVMRNIEAIGLSRLYLVLRDEADAVDAPRRSPEWEAAALAWLGEQQAVATAPPEQQGHQAATEAARACIQEWTVLAQSYEDDGQADIAGLIRREIDEFREACGLRL